ncbi:MAG: ComEC/Rec2 family competence protein [Synergistaceae bacterium]
MNKERNLNFGLLLRKYKKIFILIFTLIIGLPAGTAWISRTEVTEADAGLRYYAFDVGQGDSSLFILPDGKTILVDAGPEDAGKKLVKELKKLGVKKIDLLVATHPHSDHIGGMRRIISNFQIGKIWDSGFISNSPLQKNFYSTIQNKEIPFGRPKRGHSEKMGDVLVEVLAPARLIRGTKRDANNNCLVMNIKYGSTDFLMLADMEREQRSTVSPLPRAAVLKASHHGSSNGTDISLLKEVRPYFIILSYGRNNSYGYPHKEVVRAVSSLGIIRLDTKDGTVRIVSDGENISYPQNREAGKNGS